MSKKLITGASALAITMMTTNAEAIEFGKPISTPVVITKPAIALKGTEPKKQVTVMSIKLSPKEYHTLFSYHPKKRSTLINAKLANSIDLGMNGVPVLDQGMHGSCVTFAVTAAIDAALGKGDYVSQLCQLELGSHLETLGYFPSGWEGSFGPWVFDQMMRFGIVNKENQEKNLCANVSKYPTDDMFNEGNPMSLDDFKQISEDLSSKLYPVSHMNFIQRFDTRFADTEQAEKVLNQVKESLAKGNRSTFGTFIVLSPYCSAGACANYRAKHDTWALTKEIETPPFATGGHEMVITGYDDNAVAVDREGKRHQGLLMLRNSWGDDVGDKGNYYMTYDYFKKFVGEVQEVIAFKEEQQ